VHYRFKFIFLVIVLAFGFWMIDIYLDSIMLSEYSFLELLKMHFSGSEAIFFSLLLMSLILAASAILKVMERGKKAELNLQKSKKREQTILETSGEGFWLIDNEAVTVDVNDSMCSMMKMERNDIIGKKVTDFLDSENTKILMEQMQMRLQGQKGSYEGTFSRPDGTSVPCIINCSLLFDDEGQKIGSFAMINDITERKQIEEALREGENKHRNIIENSSFGIGTYNESGQCIVANAALAKIAGATVGQMLSQNFYTLKSWQKSGLLDAAKKSLETGEKHRRTVYVVTTFGKELWLDGVFIPYYERGAKFLMFLSEDITDRKLAEQELLKAHDELEKRINERTADLKKANEELQAEIANHKKTEENLIENEKRFRAAATTTADLIWEGDVRENTLKWHGDIDSILGYDDGEFPHTIADHMDSIHPDDRDILIKAVEHAVETGEDFFAEYRIKCKDGDYRFWDERGKAIGFENGRAVKWVGSVTDITERKLSENLLVESEEKFKKMSQEFHFLFDAIPDSLIVLSPEMKIIWSNKAFDDSIGRKTAKYYGQHCYSLCCSLSSPCNNCPVIKSFESGAEENSQVLNRDGRVLDKRAFPMFDDSGKIIKVISVSRDITARVKMEEEAKLVQSRLIHANKMTSLGTLVSGVAHEINNPNSYIMSNAQVFTEIWNDTIEVLKKNNGHEKEFRLGGIPFTELIDIAPKLLEGISDGSDRISRIVAGLKNFSRPDSANLDETVEINSVILSSKSMIESEIKRCTDKFTVYYDESLPSVKGNVQQIEQVFINLIMNALQSLPDRKHGISISSSFIEKTGEVVIEVRDDGIGMHKDMLDLITEPFFTTRINEGGTGLGLSISYAIIRDHGGSLLFESEEGRGTTVKVTLPASG
jgi:PAS domain S-box-containing protein